VTFATLGNIVFSTLQSWQTFESKRGFKYAQHDVVEAPPRLQAIARELQELTFTIILHAIMGNPETAQQQLEDAMDAHKAMPLVLGNGTHLGSFVIVELTTTGKKYAANGSIIAIEMRAQLKEYVAGASADPNAPPQPSTTPPALVEVTAGELAPNQSVAATIVTNPNGTQTVVFLKDNAGGSAILNSAAPSGPPAPGASYTNVTAATMTRAGV